MSAAVAEVLMVPVHVEVLMVPVHVEVRMRAHMRSTRRVHTRTPMPTRTGTRGGGQSDLASGRSQGQRREVRVRLRQIARARISGVRQGQDDSSVSEVGVRRCNLADVHLGT